MLKLIFVSLAVMIGSTLLSEDVYRKTHHPQAKSEFDFLLESIWKKQNITPAQEASDAVFVRRAYLDFLGRTPSVEEAKSYVASEEKDKHELLIERLLADHDFALYWSMRFGDALRIKSEFPINLWPNAAYAYTRIVYEFLDKNQTYDQFVRSLLLSEGSNFRQPEVNFYRAMAVRSPEGIANAVSSFFMGKSLVELPSDIQKTLPQFFECVKYKSTKEWKEEIVFAERLENTRSFSLPNGKMVVVKKNGDPREALCHYLIVQENPYFASALVQRVWRWFFGVELDAGDTTLRFLAADFKRSGYNLKSLCKLIGNSSAYRASSFYDGDLEKATKFHAVYPIRRLDAEVLDDTIRLITQTPARYSSVIPEPFSFIPPDARTVALADGSIDNSFLLLFGRPSRDTGLPSERSNEISIKQRLFLYNSADLFRRVSRISGPKRRPRESVENYYWHFYSRPPTAEEYKFLVAAFNNQTEKKWLFYGNLAWILLNSKEFIHQH